MADNLNAQSTGDEAAKDFVRPPAFYDAWQNAEGIPVYEAFHIDDLTAVELGPWQRFGVQGAFVNLADPFICTAMVLELAPGASTIPVKHMFGPPRQARRLQEVRTASSKTNPNEG